MNSMKTTTQGQRIRQARQATGLSQAEFARAVSHISKSRATKSLVSQWETGRVANPQNAAMLAIQAVTGYSMKWLVTNKGPEKTGAEPVSVKDTKAGGAAKLDRTLLLRAIKIAAAEHQTPAGIADAALEILDTLADSPDIPDAVLRRIARLSKPRST